MINRSALIDADSIIYICCANKKKYNENGDPIIDDLGEHVYEIKTLQQCKDLVDSMLKSIFMATKSTHYLLFLTVGRNFRYDHYKEYKGNRKYSEKSEHFDRVKEYLITDWNAVYEPGLEADDLVKIYSNSIQGSFICSPDKDILSLEGKHYNYKTHKWITTTHDEAYEKFWMDMVTGQTGDNIKGIEGSGPVAAESIKNSVGGTFRSRVFEAYLIRYGEYKGIAEFYKNYNLLKILDYKDGLILKDPIKCDKDEFA